MKLPFVTRKRYEQDIRFFQEQLKQADLTHVETLKILDSKETVLNAVEQAMPRVREKEYAKGFSSGVAYFKRLYVEHLRKTTYNAKQ